MLEKLEELRDLIDKEDGKKAKGSEFINGMTENSLVYLIEKRRRLLNL